MPTTTAPTPATVISGTPPPAASKSWRRFFVSRQFLFISVALHLLLGLVAAIWIVQVTFLGHKKPNLAGQASNAAKAATHALEHQVKMAKKKSTMSAPPALKRVMTKSMSKLALPAVPTLAAAQPVVPMAMAGMGATAAPGFGFGTGAGGGGGGGGGGGTGITSFIGGMRITAQKLGVALDTSGSVADYQQEMHDYVAKVFKGSEVSEFSAAGFFSVKSSKGSMGMSVLEFLNSPKHFDAIYIFSDFGETYEAARREGQDDLWPQVQKLMREKKVRLYIHVLPFKSGRLQESPEMANVIQLAKSSGGGVKTGDMPHASLKPGNAAADASKL